MNINMGTTKWFGSDLPGPRPQADHIFIASVLFLTGWGLAALDLASSTYGLKFFEGKEHYFLKHQILWAAIGIFLFFILSQINLNVVRKFIIFMFFGTFLLCVLTFVPGIGVEKNGARRWIGFGINPLNPKEAKYTFQPSELIKICLPFYLAHVLDKRGGRIESFMKDIFPILVVVIPFVAVVYFQNNFSTAAFIILVTLVVLFYGGMRLRWFVAAAMVIIPLAILMVLTESHRLTRVKSFLNPQLADLQGAGYQIHTSLRAINSGGFWGKGLGQGVWKVAGIPEVHSDFIFSAFAEEAGFAGILLFFALFGVFAARGYRGALRNRDNFAGLLGFGLVSVIVIQALINIAVVSGAVPTTGLPLPFFSAGGSYLLVVLIMAGFIANVSRS